MVYLVTKGEWRADENEEWNPDPRGHVRAEGRLYVSEDGWREFGVRLASGEDPLSMFEGAWQLVWRAGFEFADPGVDEVTADLRVAMVGSVELPSENVRMRLPPFLLERLGGLGLVRQAVADLASLTYEDAMVYREYYRAFLEMSPFSGEQKYEVLRTLRAVFTTRPRAPVVGDEVLWGVVRREISPGMTDVDDLHRLYEPTGIETGWLGKEMATEEGIGDQQSEGNQGTNRDRERNEGSTRDRESAKLEGTREDRKDASIGESSGKAGGSCEGRRTGQDKARYEGKDNSHKGTPSKKGKDKNDPPAEGMENAMTLPAIDSGTSRLPGTSKVTGVCDGLLSLRERVLGWFDPEGTPKTRENQRESKKGKGTSAAGEAGSFEGGLKRIVTTLTRALNKNQGYLADAKKKLTFDRANITEFLIDYENLATLLKWMEEEKMEHLGQHVSLSLGRDIMAIVASSGSWKETRNEMMRKYLKAEKMATEAELSAVHRKNYATYNDFLRAFTLVALRIPGVTNRIMSKYFLRQFSEFDKDKILSAYQQTCKFEYTRDVDFSTVTDLAEKTMVTETLALLKEGEVIDLTDKTRFILRIDPTNVARALKNYKPIDPTVGRWIGFIWQFDYKVERIAGLRNRADRLSRVCITPEGIEDEEPIDAFLDYEGGALVVDNEMADSTLTTGQLLIQTLKKGTLAVVAKLREGSVTTVRRKEEKDSWGAEVGAREELMEMAVEGGRDVVMTLAEAWAQKECQYLVNQTREEQDADRKEQEFFLIQMYEGVFRKIGVLLVGNKQPSEVSSKAREEDEKYVLRNGHLFKKEEGMTPRRVVCGRSRQLDVIQTMHDGLAGGHRLDDNLHLTTEEFITTRCQQVARNEEALDEVVNRVTDSRMKDKARWDLVKNIRKEPLQVGEKVLVRNSALESIWSGQLGKRFKGPYRIAKRVGLNTFELEDLDGTSIRGPFPGQRLARFFSRIRWNNGYKKPGTEKLGNGQPERQAAG
ncbi:hypothetical protein CBR_g12557 [Chara braunii]|uniref:Uncharacterized protein n=1 Tax=Chara braunii TaxID=69332 RepID=A0A388JSQ9_CHABU|nr:hypothetical protein CBR_g12557 [Chara braunii]|eukprot:GBG60820.1 hypothetical protein CBR_g12557 [Chara braunii]